MRLGDFVAAQRWFRSRSRTRTGEELVDVVPVDDVRLHLVRLAYGTGLDELYLVPLDAQGNDAAVRFGDRLVRARETTFAGRRARLEVSRDGVGALPEASALGAEQTNTSVRFGDAAILKLYRVLVFGPDPELEILRALRDRPDAPTPHLLGDARLVLDGEVAPVAMLQGFVPSRGDAWSVTLAALASLDSEERMGAVLEAASRLGARTAALHRALCTAFPPEPVSDLGAVVADVRRSLFGVAELGPLVPALERRLAEIVAAPVVAQRTRIHGDLHLGQVLVTPEDDFVIIDFEGEPARSLAERREKALPVRDVAGMVRSFDYAAASSRPSPWVERYRREAPEAFVAAWRRGVSGTPIAPASDLEAQRLLDLFVLHKAAYELRYELDHRPELARIPLEALRSISASAGP